MVDISYSRQINLFTPEEFNEKTHVNIIGAGATGSWLVLLLAKMGIENITVYDFDKVESHNLPNQFYGPQHVGLPKVEALRHLVKSLTNIEIKAVNERVTEDTILGSGVLVVLTDTMKSRLEFLDALPMNPDIDYLIETRMGLKQSRMYCVDVTNNAEIGKYRKTFTYTDDDENVEVSACGTSQTAVGTAVNIASQVLRAITNYHREVENPFLYMQEMEEFASHTEYRR